MGRTIRFAVALALLSSCAWAEGIGKFETTVSFQPGVTVYPQDAHAEAYCTLGCNTSHGPLNIWSGLGGTVKVSGTATEVLYPWMLSVASIEVLSLGSGVFSLRPQVTVPWSALSYKTPGVGLIARADLPMTGSGDAATSLVVQGELNFFPPLLTNPWHAAALAAGVDVGEKYWLLQYGGHLKVRFPGPLTVGIDARIESDNCAYYAGGAWFMTPSADLAAMVELPGLSVRAGIVLNGWNQAVSGGQREYVVLPSFSVVFGEIPVTTVFHTEAR